MDKKDRLAILTAIERALKAELAQARQEVKDELLELNEEFGVTKVTAKFGEGEANFTVSMTSGGYEVYDSEEFVEFMVDHNMVRYEAKPEWIEHVIRDGNRAIWTDTGEPVPGVYYEEPRAKGIVVKLTRPEEILQAAMLQGYTMPLLEGGQGADNDRQ